MEELLSHDFEIPFTFGPHTAGEIGTDRLVSLGYRILGHGLTQRQFRNRKVIKPCLDLDEYRFAALIDWIEIRFRTSRSTNFHTVQRRLREVTDQPVWVESAGGAAHHADTKFIARIQDPDRDQLLAIRPALHAAFGLVGPIEVNGIEIAVDVRPKITGLRGRLAMVVLLQRHVLVERPEWTDRNDDARHVYRLISGGSSKPSRLIQAIRGKAGSGAESDRNLCDPLVRKRILRMKSHRAPYADSTLYFGREGGPVMVSIEDKTTNRRNPQKKTVVSLSAEECRARVEVRLRGDAPGEFGMAHLDDVIGYRFEGLQTRFFSFWLPTVPSSGGGPGRVGALLAKHDIEIFENSGVYGLDRYEAAKLEERRQVAMLRNAAARSEGHGADSLVPARQRAKVRPHRVSYEPLNAKVRVALRGLSRRMSDHREKPLMVRFAA